MTIFLILAPYGAFASLMLVASATESLIVAVFVSLGTIALDAVRGRSLKILPTGTAILFAFQLGWGGQGVWLGLAADLFAVSALLLWRWSIRGRLGLVPVSD